MDLANIVLSERSQTERAKDHLMSLWGMNLKAMNTNSTEVVVRGRGWGRGVLT